MPPIVEMFYVAGAAVLFIAVRHVWREWKWRRDLMNEHKKVKGWDEEA